MTETTEKIISITAVVAALFIAGFFVGRCTITEPEPKIVTEYIKGETIHDSIYISKPYEVKRPADTANIIKECVRRGLFAELMPYRVDTLLLTHEDSTNVLLQDYASQRTYKEVLFDNDTLGKCSVTAEVQYNRLNGMSYDFTPVIKTVTKTEYKVKAVSPFVSAGALYNPWDSVKDPMIEIGGGIFVKEKYGIELQYQHGFSSKGDFVGGQLIYKF